MVKRNTITSAMATVALGRMAVSARHPSVTAFTPTFCEPARAASSLPSLGLSPSTVSLKYTHSYHAPTHPIFSTERSWLSSLFSTAEEVDPGVVEGTDLRVLKYPHPSLRAENEEISTDELTGPGSEISRIAKDMFLVMYASNGVGLAAPQVGINKRLMVYNESGDKTKWLQEVVMVNPRIVEFSGATDIEEEGCLSFPDMRGKVERSKWIKVEALNLKGKKIKKKFVGWEARIFQHEYDHLDGTVYIDRLSRDGRSEIQPKLDKLVSNFGEGGAL